MSNPNYNQKRKKADFLDWIERWYADRLNLSRVVELNDRDRESKKMHEEAFVVYRYVMKQYRDRDIAVELNDGNQNYDAVVYDENGDLLEYLEVTCVPQKDDHKLRKELAERGSHSLITMLTHHPTLSSYALLVNETILKKLAKTYPPGTTLLVALSSEMILDDDDKFNYVIFKIDSTASQSNFSNVVIIDEPGRHLHIISRKVS